MFSSQTSEGHLVLIYYKVILLYRFVKLIAKDELKLSVVNIS